MKTTCKAKPGYITSAFAIAVLMAILVPVAGAQNYDPPGRVARIRYLQGSVSFRPAGENDWVTAVTNRPMTTGDQIWADAGSRAEVQLGSATIRLNENTGFSFLNLDDQTVQIQLTNGTLNLRVRRIHPNEVFEVDTPNEAFTVTRAGQYRVDAGSDGNSSMVTVRQGQGEVTGGGRTYYVASGQTGTFNGTDSLDGYVAPAPNPDDFDNWGITRDRRYEGSQSARYVSPDMVGYEDLDNNGSWRSDPRYGNVWYPTSVQSGWAPYRDGHWVWVAPWGWTWVDDAPWGYAPSHYGRWIYNQGNWGWVPGPMNSEPVYAPALVAFVGGSGFGVSLSIGGGGGGNVGWFPLGPREVYVPSYNVSPAYVNRVNVSNTTVSTTTITNVYNNQVTNISNSRTNITYANQSVPGAVTAVPQAAFSSAQPVARAAVHVDPKQIASAPVVARAPVVPTQNSVLGATASSANRVTRPPEAVASRPVVAKTTPPPPPVPFVRQQQELAKHPGQPLAPREVQTLRPSAAAAQPQVKQAPPGKQAALNPSRPPNQPMAGNAKQPTPSQPALQKPNGPVSAPVATAPAPPVRGDRPPSAQQQAVQQQADKAKQQQAAQQQAAEKTRAEQAAQQQASERAKQQQAAQQQAAQQQAAEKARAEQAAQQQASERAKQQQAAQQQAAQQQAAQQQATERAKQQQVAQQQAAQQQAAEKLREQQAAQQQAQRAQQQPPPQRTDRPPSSQTAQPPQQHPAQPAATPQNRPLTPAEKAREEEQKKQQQGQKQEPPQAQ